MTKKIGRVSYILILLVILAVIGVFAHFTSGFSTDFKTFYVSVDNKDIMTLSSGYVVSRSSPLSVDVKYTFETIDKENTQGYTVKIVPNKVDNKDFIFTKGNETVSFQSIKDLTDAFEIVKKEKSFTVAPKGETLTEMLSAMYGEEISGCENKCYEDMFTIIVTSYNGTASVKLNCSLSGVITGITLDKEVIRF